MGITTMAAQLDTFENAFDTLTHLGIILSTTVEEREIRLEPNQDTAICANEVLPLTVLPVSGTSLPPSLSYAWSSGATSSSISAAPGTAYYVTVSSDTCSLQSDTLTIAALPAVAAPILQSGPLSICPQTSSTYTFSTASANAITFTITPPDAAASISPSSINDSLEQVIIAWSANASGTVILKATAEGCEGPQDVDIPIQVRDSVEEILFASFQADICQASPSTQYTATANNATSISYALSPSNAGNINNATGLVSWANNFIGTATITATAIGSCNTVLASIQVVVNANVTQPIFDLDFFDDSLCQDPPNTLPVVIVANDTNLIYQLSPSEAGQIDEMTGEIDWTADFDSIATLVVIAEGCGMSQSDTVDIKIQPNVGNPTFAQTLFSLCEDPPNTTYLATAPNSIDITYGLSPPNAGNINAQTGEINWTNDFVDRAFVSATATGCGVDKIVIDTVDIKASVATPNFNMPPDSSVCQGDANISYLAIADRADSIIYTLNPATNGTINRTSGEVDWSLQATGTTFVKAVAFGCNGPREDSITVLISPTPPTPILDNFTDTVCTDQLGVNFNVSNPDPGLTYTWGTPVEGLLLAGQNQPNATFGFTTDSQSITIRVEAQTDQGCKSEKTIDVVVKPEIAEGPYDIQLLSGANILVCLENTVDSYQWGYDDKILQLQPVELQG
ncbi:MAG: hypothetical protein AAFR59_08630, partial [Bacteroidota bacterium]